MIRDVPSCEYFDLRVVEPGENCIRCNSGLDVFKAIELGHIFKLGTKYSEALSALFIDEKGEEHPIIMGSYGIGLERIVACFIEQNFDEKGIVWNKILSPFQIHLIGLNMKNQKLLETSEKIYNELKATGYDVLFDDRLDASAGFKFNDADLLGMPLQVIVGEKNLKENCVEIKVRKTGTRIKVKIDSLGSEVKKLLNSN
jgi:prolyl-tRNA synthetase